MQRGRFVKAVVVHTVAYGERTLVACSGIRISNRALLKWSDSNFFAFSPSCASSS
jgi:hypothetical protein